MDEELKSLIASLKEGVDKGNKESALNAEETAKIKTTLEGIEKTVEDLKAKRNVSLPGSENENFQFQKCFRAMAKGQDLSKLDGVEGEIIRQTQKAQTITPSTAGGVFVPTEIANRVIDKAIAMTVLNSLPIQRFNMGGSNKLQIPTVTTNPTAAWIQEFTNITASSAVFSSKTMEPWKCAGYVEASNELLAQENADIEGWVLNQLAKQIALAIDSAGLQGAGSGSYQPEGILNTTGIIAVTPGVNGDAATWETMSYLQELLEDVDTFQGSLAYISHPGVFRRIREQTVPQFSGQAAADAQPIMDPFAGNAALEARIGMPLKSTTQLALSTVGTNECAALICGDFSQFAMALWGGLELASDTSITFQKYGTAMRALQRVDMKVLRANSFAVNPSVAVRAS